MTSSAPAPWCEPAGPGGSSPWKVGPARSPARRPWRMWACSTGSTPASPRSPPEKCGKPPRDISRRTRWPAWPTSRPTRGAVSPRIRSGARSRSPSSARHRLVASPRVQPRRACGRPRAAGARCQRHPTARRRPAGVSQDRGAARHSRDLCPPPAVRPAGAGRARFAAGPCGGARRGRLRRRRARLRVRAPGRNGGYQLGLRLAGLRRFRPGGAPGRGGHAAGHRFPPPPPARPGHRGRA